MEAINNLLIIILSDHMQDDCLLFVDQRTAFSSERDGGSRFLLLPERFPAEPLSAALRPVWWEMVKQLLLQNRWVNSSMFALKCYFLKVEMLAFSLKASREKLLILYHCVIVLLS